MKQDPFRQIAAVILLLLGVLMIIIGLQAHILPPPITGVGFILIAFIFLREKKSGPPTA